MATLIAWALSAWRWIASSRIAQAVIAIGGFLVWLKWKLMQAKREGAEQEREEAEQQAREHRAEHEGDVHAALQKRKHEQQERRDRESDEDPRDRFSRQPRR